MRRNGGNQPVAPAGGGVDSPRFKILVFLLYFTLTFVAVRVWMVIVDTKNVYLEAAGALVTLLFLYCLYWYFQRLMTMHRQRMEALREGRRSDPSGGEIDLDAVQLRIQLRRLYGEGVDVDTLLQQGLPWETINSCLRYFTFNRDKCQLQMASADPALSGITGCTIDNTHLSNNNNNNTSLSSNTDIDLEQGLNTPPPSPAVSQECAVCLCDFADGDALIELPCRHAYHQGCITDWLLTHNACPLCKQCVVKIADLRRMIDRMLDQQDVTGGTTATTGSAESASSAYGTHSLQGNNSLHGNSLHGNSSVHSVHSTGNSEGAGRLLISTLLRTAIQEEDDQQLQESLRQEQLHGSSAQYAAIAVEHQDVEAGIALTDIRINSVTSNNYAAVPVSGTRDGRTSSIDSCDDATRTATYTH